jgi:hypothetical protein
MRKVFVVTIGLVMLIGGGLASAGPRHGSGWSRGYCGGWRGPRHGYGGQHYGWHGRHGYWGPGWSRGRWYGPGWRAPYIVDSAIDAGLAAYAIHEAAENREVNYYYSAPAYPYPSYYYAPPCVPPVSYEPLGSRIVTETVTVVE